MPKVCRQSLTLINKKFDSIAHGKPFVGKIEFVFNLMYVLHFAYQKLWKKKFLSWNTLIILVDLILDQNCVGF